MNLVGKLYMFKLALSTLHTNLSWVPVESYRRKERFQDGQSYHYNIPECSTEIRKEN